MSNRTFLYSGGMGGSSTFIGGLFTHINNSEDLSATYNIRAGDEEEFRENILRRMNSEHKYPEKSDSLFRVSFTLDGGSSISDGEVILSDIPGDRFEASIIDDNLSDLDEVETKRQYEKLDVEARLQDGSSDFQDYEVFIDNEFIRSDSVIFVLNLYKLLYDSRELAFDAEELKRVSDEKDVAVVVTGADLLDYRSDDEVVSNSGGLFDILSSESPVDSGLLAEIEDAVSLGTSPRAVNILNTIGMRTDIAFFGVSVSGSDPDSLGGEIEVKGGTIRTHGFENAVRWLF